ncbi:hypothetical protein LAZ67_20000324 [Cordylochernes scorpioides]|uniref:Transposase n=1 Tax=Cordylochernes scorpioides TaxID=51811 RepID=A0ABY6LJE4_9ARAC|nr:hypothetical protein LAZ67_20000324 [Cordylochernes scorpioides]
MDFGLRTTVAKEGTKRRGQLTHVVRNAGFDQDWQGIHDRGGGGVGEDCGVKGQPSRQMGQHQRCQKDTEFVEVDIGHVQDILQFDGTLQYNTAVVQQTVSKAIHRFNELGREGDRAGRGRKLTANRKIIKKRLQRNSRVSVRKNARETGKSNSSVHRIAKKELNLKAYKLQKVQLLTDKNKRVRLERCHHLKHRTTGQRWKCILFTDEKLFPLEQTHNHKTTGAGSLRLLARHPSSNTAKIRSRLQYGLEFAPADVLPWAQQHFGDADKTFQQDSAPAHKAKLTQDWCRAHFPDFFESAEWSTYSPDVNPMGYSVWFRPGPVLYATKV